MTTDPDRVARTYAAAADHDSAPALGFWRRYGRRTVDRLTLGPGQRVYDACCGSGESALAAARAVGPEGGVLGVDLAAPMVTLAASKAAGLGNVEFRCGDAGDTGLPDGSFDAVVCVFGVFFAPDPAAFVAELWRLVAPGGVLAITTWGPRLFEPGNTEFWAAVSAASGQRYEERFRPWDEITTPAALADLMRRAGVPRPHAEAEPGWQDLATPADFWHIVQGTGYRGTVDGLSAKARDQVRTRLLQQLSDQSVRRVETNVVYGTARA